VKTIITSGKRKGAIARAVIRPGKGIFTINNILIDVYEPKLARQRLGEPLVLAGDRASKANISVTIKGGGIMGQADAGRLAIARALLVFTNDKELEKTFLEYDRQLLVADIRHREVRKPNTHGNARGKVQKSYR